MNCEKLSLDACMHAAQNDRLPLRSVIQVMFVRDSGLESDRINCTQNLRLKFHTANEFRLRLFAK